MRVKSNSQLAYRAAIDLLMSPVNVHLQITGTTDVNPSTRPCALHSNLSLSSFPLAPYNTDCKGYFSLCQLKKGGKKSQYLLQTYKDCCSFRRQHVFLEWQHVEKFKVSSEAFYHWQGWDQLNENAHSFNTLCRCESLLLLYILIWEIWNF